MSLTRRRTLIWLGASTAVVPLMGQAQPVATSSQTALTVTAQLRELVRGSPLAPAIGRGYRSQYPREADAAVLTRLVCLDLGLRDALDSQSNTPQQWIAQLNACVRAQFASAETVSIEGWILARTEARLCALCE